MDKHYLTPLFSPSSVLVFADSPTDGSAPVAQPQALHQALTSQRFNGELTFLDTQTTGTLAELADTRADLAIISLPHPEVAAALEVAGRMKCKAALVVSAGMGTDQAAELKTIAKRSGVHLLGPNCLGFQRPHAGLNASVAGPLAAKGSLALVSQSGALTSSIRLGTQQQRWLFGRGVFGPQHGGGHCRRARLPGRRRTNAKHRGVHGRHFECPPLHERAARRRQRQTRGGAESRAQKRGQCRGPNPQRHHRGQRRRV
jgi:hypothetical protein